MDLEEMKARARTIWDAGDYGPTGRMLAPVSDALVGSLGIRPDHRVLDVASGHGNCAIAAARTGARVIASDFAPRMIDAGRRRTVELGLDVPWYEADAADLPFEDGSFDRVTSVFGAIFAPEQERVAGELVRVTRSGGRIGLTSWPDDGFSRRFTEVLSRYGPPSEPDAPDPMAWGRPEHVMELFAATGSHVDIRRRSFVVRYASWDEWRAGVEAHGMATIARRTMAPDRYERMLTDMREVIEEIDRGEGGEVAYDAEYLEILVSRT